VEYLEGSRPAEVRRQYNLVPSASQVMAACNLLSYFFVKNTSSKVGAESMLWMGQWMSQ